jgi:hypothetical protein
MSRPAALLAIARSLPAIARSLLALALSLLAAGPARAQTAMGHPAPEGPRPLHRLVAEADVIAIATIATIDAADPGRIRVRDALPIVGVPGASFELKRAPSNPPVFPIGSRALLLLRGARAPYVLVDAPRENVVVADPASEARWADALRALRAATGDPLRLRDVYLAWCDGDVEALRQQATRGLYDAEAGFHPLPPELGVERARRALDPALPAGVRRSSAAVAILTPEGTSALVAGAPPAGAGEGSGAADVLEIAIQGAMLRNDGPGLGGAVQRGLASSDTSVRRVAARYGAQISLPDVRAAVAKLATTDPDPEVRKLAEKVAAGGGS